MHDAFTKPPASVHEACLLYLDHKGVSHTDPAAALLMEAVAFGCAATAGRQMARLQPKDRRCNTCADLLQVKAESEQVFIEATHMADNSARALNA